MNVLLRLPWSPIGCVAFLTWFAAQAGAAENASALFDKPTLLRMEINLATNELAKLQERPREAVPARVGVDGKEFLKVAVRLKGGPGSFRPLDEKPAWTLDFNKYARGQNMSGLTKLHLNNSVQDSTYLCEDLSGELFRRAGVPAPRIAWAKVKLNGRDLGLYVVKEGITKDWLKKQFGDGEGNLYDSGTHQEVTDALRLDSGSGSRSDLRGLADAANIGNAAQRWEALQAQLDMDRFFSFMACEILANHADGYSLMQNNYRIYFEPESKRAVFLPQGMDRMFWEPGAAVEPGMKALVAAAVTSVPEGQARYRARVKELAKGTLDPTWITNRIDSILAVIGPVEPLAARDAEPLRARILERIEFVRKKTAAW